jgi:uncharacterized protein (TIGR02145 family)
MYLEHGQGMSIAQQNLDFAWRGDGAGQGTPSYKIRSQGTGFTNASGFSGLLAGFRLSSGSFYERTGITGWWSSSASGATAAHHRSLRHNFSGVFRNGNFGKSDTYSVRCLKD